MTAANPAPPAGDAAGLEEERDFLLASLRDLERERAAGDLDEADYLALKESYTARAAAVLRALESPPENSGEAVGFEEDRSGDGLGWRRRALGVVLVAAVALAGGLGVARWSGERVGDRPITGSVSSGLADRLAEAHRLDGEGKAVEALKRYDAVLREDPRNVEALAYRGWLLKRAGLADAALASLDRAVAIDPRYPDAHFFRGMVLYQDRNDPAAAVPEFQAFLANDPPPAMVGPVEEVLNRARRDAGLPVPPTTAAG